MPRDRVHAEVEVSNTLSVRGSDRPDLDQAGRPLTSILTATRSRTGMQRRRNRDDRPADLAPVIRPGSYGFRLQPEMLATSASAESRSVTSWS